MSPDFCTWLAMQLFARRWWLFGWVLLGTLGGLAVFYFGSPATRFIASALSGPLIFVPWGLLCVCLWFHPQFGLLLATRSYMRRLPGIVQWGIRWYASVFICLYTLATGLAWPALVLITQ